MICVVLQEKALATVYLSMHVHYKMIHSGYVGKDAGRAETIFSKMDQVLQENKIPWSNCVGFVLAIPL